MIRKFLFLCVTMAMGVSASAQHAITGLVVEGDSREAMAMATIKLMKTDSTLVKNAVTSTKGLFSVAAPKNGSYIVSISNVGFDTYTRNITVKDKDVNLGTLALSPSSVMLKETTVTGQATKVIVKEDTLMYNAAAYQTPEGSVVEELVKKLPGAEVDDDGNVKINGQEVRKILVDGKEFMMGDTKTALKNLPTNIIDRIKTYKEKSDLARVSGIDDGNEQTVLDFGVKPGMNRGTLTNTMAGYGTDNRYTARVMVGQFNSDLKVVGMGNANNVSGRGFGRGGGRSGLTASKSVSTNIDYNTEKFKLNGSVRWSHSDGDSWSKTSSEDFVNTVGSFSNSVRQSYSRGNQWNANMRFEWAPDTMTNIMFRPNISYSTNDGINRNSSATYREDPYLWVTDPLNQEALEYLRTRDSMLINSRSNRGINYSENKNFGGSIQFNRRLNNDGRNITVVLNANYGDSKSKSFSTNNVNLYQVKNHLGNDSLYQTNRFNLNPSEDYSYSINTTYSEPIMRATFLQLSYNFSYSHTKSDRSTYDFSNLGEDYFSNVGLEYQGWDSYLSLLDHPYNYYVDEDLSRFSEYNNWTHNIQLQLRVIRDKYHFNAGVTVIPQKTEYVQQYMGHDIDTVRNVVNFSPTINFRWRISKISNMNVTYYGRTGQPGITDLMDIRDDSDPLNISTGNPGLRPSFTHSFGANYDNFIEFKNQAINANVNFSTTTNNVSRKVTYNTETGGRLTRPENINGNWDVRGGFMYNTAIDTARYFNLNTSTDVSYANHVGYVTIGRTNSSQKSTTRSTNISERLGASYRNGWIEFEINGSVNYSRARNTLQPNSNLDTWRFNYGFDTNIRLPWNMQISTNMGMNSRRGYSDATLNTNELIWNAQISQSLLKGNMLTLSLQLYDILKEQSNFSRSINAMGRTDTEFNSITSYAMFTANFMFNAIGGRGARNGMGGGRGGFGGGGRGGFGGGGRGGFGGGGRF